REDLRDRGGDERDPAHRHRQRAPGRPDRLRAGNGTRETGNVGGMRAHVSRFPFPVSRYGTPRFFTRNAHRSACSSMSLLVGLPAPCPALVSIWMRTGLAHACAACRAAVNLNECPGTTRSSWSAVVTKVAG